MMCVTDLLSFSFFGDRKGDITFQIKINFKQEKYEKYDTEGVKAIGDVE